MTSVNRRMAIGIAVLIWPVLSAGTVRSAAPTDNPVASYYNGDRGYPAWTDGIKWANVIDMKSCARGKTNFEKFENARAELIARGGGVLYYPGGAYDFSDGPFDGPGGRGLMLPSGVVIRGEAPKGKPLATAGKLDLATKFVFGFKRRDNAIDVGKRMTLVLDGGEIRVHKRGKRPVTYEPAELILSFAIENGKISSQVKAFRRGYGRDVWTGRAKVGESGKTATIRAELTGGASYDITITRGDDGITGKFTGKCNGRKTKGKITGRELTITPETPRDWNLIGLAPASGKSVKDVNNVGVAWVHIVGGVVYFGPDIAWGKTWATAGSWKSRYIKKSWANRKPDGRHPWDPFAGGGRMFAGSGSGRLVFGCVLEQSAVLNDSVRMGRPDNVEGFGEKGYYTHKFGPRIAVYGRRVLVANNLLPMSRGRNFKYAQTTRRTFPSGGGASMGFDPPRKSTVFFDYNKTLAIGINKSLLGLTKNSPTGKAGAGFFSEGVAVIDNWVYNNGHKGYDISGSWVTIARNHNERQMLEEGWDPERIGGWELTLDGHLESSPGGNGAISDNLSRAFDLAGRNVWVHRNTYNNLGSDPGNDGEGILCQAHGGSQVFSWAITYNKHEKGGGETGYIGGWDVNMAGALFGWNVLPGWIGSTKVAERSSADTAFVANQAGSVKPMKGAQVGDGPAKPAPPVDVKAEIYKNNAVKIIWKDKCNGEAGFRIDRRIAGGKWTPIAYRPPQITAHADNRPEWIDFLAPSGKELIYRVAALNARDDDSGASKPTSAVEIGPPSTWIAQMQTATAPPATAAGKLDPGDASWNIRLVELWGRGNRNDQRNMDIYPRFKNGRWSRAIVTARRYNTSIHFVEKADVTLDGMAVKGKLEITVSPDRWVPKDGQLDNVTVDFSAKLMPSSGERPFALAGKYAAIVRGRKVTGRVEGYVEAAEKGFETSRWSVNLNQVPTPGAPNLPMLQVTVGMTGEKVKWGSIGAIWRRLSRPSRIHRFDATSFKHDAGVITGTTTVPARALNVAADPEAVTELQLKLIRIQGLPGGRATLTTKLDGRTIDPPRTAMGRGMLQTGPNEPPSGLWRYDADTAPWWTPVKGFKPVKPGEHPRMLFRKADAGALRAKAQTAAGKAIIARLRTLLGNNGDSLPTTFNTTPPHNHAKSPKFPPGVFTTWHGSGYGMLYQLTGDKKYARLSQQAVQLAFDKKIDLDNRYSWFKPGTSLRAGSILAGIALAYDLCYDAWAPEFRTRVAREIQNYSKEAATGETITLKHLAGRGGYPPSSNHYGAYLGAGAAVLAILGDPGTDSKRLSKRLAEYEQMLVQILCQGFGDGGWYAEGYHPSRVSANCGMHEFVAALRNAAGRDYMSARPNFQWITLRWIMEVIPDARGKPIFPSRGVYGGEYLTGAGSSHSGEIAYGFGGIEPKHRPALLWVYQNFIHPHRGNYGINTYPHRAVNAFVNWPTDAKPVNPAEVMPKTVADTIHGYFACRNRWKDADDIVITHLLHVGPWGYHRVKDGGHIRLWGLGVRASWKTEFREATPTFYKAEKDGSMVLSARKAGEISSLAVDFSGVSGAPAVLVGVGPGFSKTSLSRAEAKNGATAKAVSVKAVARTFHVVTLQKGAPPKVTAAGDAVKVGKQTFSFDGKRISKGK